MDQPEGPDQIDEVQLTLPEEKLMEILDMVLEEVDYLVDDKLREQLSEMPEVEQLSSKLEIVKKCLGIDSIEEINMFIEGIVENCR